MEKTIKDEPIKIFISYAWTSDDYKEKVLNLADRLQNHGIQVIIDEWELEGGKDKFHFMESMVNSNDIHKVLVLCNSEYKRKSNDRKGGVGYETTIITPAVAKDIDDTKFIPIIFESTNNPEDLLPAYLSSKIFIDLSNPDNFEDRYEELLRTLYSLPRHPKPKLGKKPEWLKNDEGFQEYANLRHIRMDMQKATTQGHMDILKHDYLNMYIKVLEEYKIPDPENGKIDINEAANKILQKIDLLKPAKDEFIKFLLVLIKTNNINDSFLPKLFEAMYNNLLTTGLGTSDELLLAHYEFLLWELVINTITVFMHYEYYDEISNLIYHTYYLKMGRFRGNKTKASTIINFFYRNSELIQNAIKSTIPQGSRVKFNYIADILVRREVLPSITPDTIACADLLIFLITTVNKIEEATSWFPSTYIYEETFMSFLDKFNSLKFCKKALVLFNLNSINELKESLKGKSSLSYNGYRGSMKSLNSYLKYFEQIKIATRP